MVDSFSVENKTFIIVAELLKLLPQLDVDLSNIKKNFYLLKNFVMNGLFLSIVITR